MKLRKVAGLQPSTLLKIKTISQANELVMNLMLTNLGTQFLEIWGSGSVDTVLCDPRSRDPGLVNLVF